VPASWPGKYTLYAHGFVILGSGHHAAGFSWDALLISSAGNGSPVVPEGPTDVTLGIPLALPVCVTTFTAHIKPIIPVVCGATRSLTCQHLALGCTDGLCRSALTGHWKYPPGSGFFTVTPAISICSTGCRGSSCLICRWTPYPGWWEAGYVQYQAPVFWSTPNRSTV